MAGAATPSTHRVGDGESGAAASDRRKLHQNFTFRGASLPAFGAK
jgi:hypothetical protein